ncbi:hypothetical protein BU23DRAFT_601205 [Bimuria novae-zelandiae CBS 107.79]|uniref:Zn(2)-C6 fungal-type domain-containing protein n=1 Tax=Bimuria novae-zelandiae CBS 107.79 TaxID=1447943 RepID=A0A6A5UZI8_9PLEO|nr:hypothetical protein BU23DRAFT_601205 [Bimuria novae-zelandiae CBS 107.79]
MANLSSESPLSRPRVRRRKAKTGCRTCKIRKVKCDEGWPACRVCISTGRVCDGYGIWGGGGNRYEERGNKELTAKLTEGTQSSHSAKLLVEGSVFRPIIPVSSTEEHLHFQFFKDETITRLPGVYSSKYNNVWDTLVMQACAEEPAVLHAVLAISSAHRRKLLDGVSRNKVLVQPDEEEEFLLRNYCKSIEYLQPKYHAAGEHSLRTVLITCLVFIYLELLRGNYKRAYDHLESGMKLLSSLTLETNKKRTWSRVSSSSCSRSKQHSVDGFLAEAFARLRVQIEFANQRGGTGSAILAKLPPDLPTFKFDSPYEARHYLDRVLEAVTRFSQAVHDGTHNTWPPGYWNMLETERRFMQGSLDSWLRSYDATLADGVSVGKDDIGQYELLRIYHTMAGIMAATSLSPYQCVFDQYGSEFLSIIMQSKDIASRSDSSGTRASGEAMRLESCGHAWPDVSWIPPLYYTALKCRVHHIRTQAVELMSSFWRYEIVWDLGILNMASIVAKEVIRLEESACFKVQTQESNEKATGAEVLEHCAQSVPSPLPEVQRFDTVEMVLPDDQPGFLHIVCKKTVRGQIQMVQQAYNETVGKTNGPT